MNIRSPRSMILLVIVTVMLSSCQPLAYSQGQRIYEIRCGNCHMPDGSGLSSMYPNLQSSELVKTGGLKLVCIILQGKNSSIVENIAMPSNADLTNAELGNLINYLNNTWGNQKDESPKDVKKYRSDCQN